MEEGRPVVRTSLGPVCGATYNSVTGGQYYGFKGIPYAKPPVGPLRFQPPQYPEPWTDTRDALTEGNPPPAYAMASSTGQYLEGSSEDCLYLNVYTPQKPGSGAKKPVLFWIHGGGFNTGNANSDFYGPDHLVDKDVVLVACNYRLGILGFLSLQTPECPGNNGLKDIVAALKWVQMNIVQFGGDPGNVTLFGESAGGAAVQYMMLSPLSRGLFHRAVSMSGSVLNPWALANKPRENAFCAAKLLGCDTKDDNELLQFFGSVPAKELVLVAKTVPPIVQPEEPYLALAFVPVIEPDRPGAFLTRHPEELLREGDIADIPYIMGGTDMEGILLAKGGDQHMKGDSEEDYARIIPFKLRHAIATDLDKVVLDLKLHFFEDGFTKERFMKAMAPSIVWSGIDNTIRFILANKAHTSPLYLYHFIFDGHYNLYKRAIGASKYAGASHADDLGYIFHAPSYQPPVNDLTKELKVIDRFTRLLTNFAKGIDPTPNLGGETFKWPPVVANKISCLEISEEIRIVEDPHGAEIGFWRQLYKQYLKQ